MRVLVAPDCYGDSLSAVEAAAAIATGWTRSRPGDSFIVAPQSDGGPGFVEVLGSRLGETRRLRVCGPLNTVVNAAWVFDPGSATAYLECAQACGLGLLGGPPTPETALAATGDDMCRTTIYDQLRRYPWPQGHTMSVLSNALTDQFEDTELDILHREEAMARYWRAVAARDYSIANVTAGQAAGLVNAVLPAADVITGMAQQAARTLTAMRAV
ncbi:hypothetical protein GR254_13810 [Mycobacterium tuberculosis]|nr:hypothetical protein [Mycobacterium tuberculosis]